MTSECGNYRQWIVRSCMGDLTVDEQKALDMHIASCPPCRDEHEGYAETLRLLQSAGDEAVPRHFFVYPGETVANPWQLFRQMLPRWQAVTAGAFALLLLLGFVGVIGIQVRADQGSYTLSFGHTQAATGLNADAIKTEILRITEERNREAAKAWVRDMQVALARSRTDLSEQQRLELGTALTALESRLNSQITLTAADLRQDMEKSTIGLYQNLSLQRQQDLKAVNARIDGVAEDNETKARETDAILETLLQVAELRIRQNGDQK